MQSIRRVRLTYFLELDVDANNFKVLILWIDLPRKHTISKKD